MDKKDIKPHVKVRNIHYQTIEEILHTDGIMKDSQKGWIDAVTYGGIDRNTGKYRVFTKSQEEFCKEFELYKQTKFVNNTFD